MCLKFFIGSSTFTQEIMGCREAPWYHLWLKEVIDREKLSHPVLYFYFYIYHDSVIMKLLRKPLSNYLNTFCDYIVNEVKGYTGNNQFQRVSEIWLSRHVIFWTQWVTVNAIMISFKNQINDIIDFSTGFFIHQRYDMEVRHIAYGSISIEFGEILYTSIIHYFS